MYSSLPSGCHGIAPWWRIVSKRKNLYGMQQTMLHTTHYNTHVNTRHQLMSMSATHTRTQCGNCPDLATTAWQTHATHALHTHQQRYYPNGHATRPSKTGSTMPCLHNHTTYKHTRRRAPRCWQHLTTTMHNGLQRWQHFGQTRTRRPYTQNLWAGPNNNLSTYYANHNTNSFLHKLTVKVAHRPKHCQTNMWHHPWVRHNKTKHPGVDMHANDIPECHTQHNTELTRRIAGTHNAT